MASIPAWLSDAMCRLATGGGFATRELYTDNEEMIFDVMRPVIINGIEELATRSDLLDRSICITLPTIPVAKRKTEKELWQKLKRNIPQILGAFLDAVSTALREYPSVVLPNPPRMADFATWAVAGEKALGLARGTFMQAYNINRESANDLAIEVSPIGPAIQEFMDDRSSWEGTAQELLDQLVENHCSEQTKNRRDWPKTPQSLGKALRRIAPNMRRSSIDVRFDRGTDKKRRRLIILERLDVLMSEPSATSTSNPLDPKGNAPSPGA